MTDRTEGLIGAVVIARKRDDVVRLYADAILWECYCSPPQATTDWQRVNADIIKRWSMSALEYIKSRAWKLAEELAHTAVVNEATRPMAPR